MEKSWYSVSKGTFGFSCNIFYAIYSLSGCILYKKICVAFNLLVRLRTAYGKKEAKLKCATIYWHALCIDETEVALRAFGVGWGGVGWSIRQAKTRQDRLGNIVCCIVLLGISDVCVCDALWVCMYIYIYEVEWLLQFSKPTQTHHLKQSIWAATTNLRGYCKLVSMTF